MRNATFSVVKYGPGSRQPATAHAACQSCNGAGGRFMKASAAPC
jgi:hypothetical protein